MTPGHPIVSVIISTRDRAARAAASVEVILASQALCFELIVVDQSEDELTCSALKTFGTDERFRYLKCSSRGVSAGRNYGISQARAGFLFITDDDCEPFPDTLSKLCAALETDPRIAVVFGNVLPPPLADGAGFVPAYVRASPYLARTIREKHRVEGLSACMGIRKQIWERLGGFDAMLGVGAPLGSGAESDFTIRALLAGFFVLETPEVRVIHFGFRTTEDTRQLVHRYWYGTGAVFAKHLKCGQIAVLWALARLAVRWLLGRPSRVAASVGGRTHHLLRLTAFSRGFVAGLRAPVRRCLLQFVPRTTGV